MEIADAQNFLKENQRACIAVGQKTAGRTDLRLQIAKAGPQYPRQR